MKRLPIIKKSDSRLLSEGGGRLWTQTPGEFSDDPAIEKKRVSEFEGERPFEPPPGVDRRTFLTLMGASMALGGLATGCRRPEEKILPYTHRPEDAVDGRPMMFATSTSFYGTAIGLLVESTDGRPTKIEGNPDHPDSLGGTTAYLQAMILDLYDPDRSKAAHRQGKELPADQAWTELGALGRELKAKAGKGLAILTEDHRSPTTRAALEALTRDMPEAKIVRFEPFGRENAHAGTELAFGTRFETVHDLQSADVIVSLDADFLTNESSPIKNAKAFSKRRRVELVELSRLYVAEASPTCTGLAADHRLRIQSRQIPALAAALAAALGAANVKVDPALTSSGGAKLSEKQTKFIQAAAKDLARVRGRGVVIVGRRQPPGVHALAAALNHALGSIGKTVRYMPAFDTVAEGPAALAGLAAAMKKKEVDTLVILGGNPAFTAPAELGFEAALKGVKTSIHLSTHPDETSLACTLHLPRAHFLESWGDTSAEDGTAAITQPLIAPMYGGRTDAEVLEQLVGGMRSPYDLVMGTWGKILGPTGFDKAFRRVIHDGKLTAPPARGEVPSLRPVDAALWGLAAPAPTGEFDVDFAPCPHAYDGRFANNGWMLEAPSPIHKGTWMTMAAISHATAQKLNVENGDHLDVSVGDRTVTVPAVISYGHADDAVTLPVGLGRRMQGRVCTGVGVDVGAVRIGAGWNSSGGTVKKGAGHTKLAITQGHFVMEGRPLVRTQTVAEYKADPVWAKDIVERQAVTPPLLNLYQDYQYPGFKWGMAIDLSLCTGCSACVTACQAENNIPVLGISGVLRSREMHWLRIDRYFAGKDGIVEAADDAESAAMPMTCQHCENAPCEQVCPVAATVHSPEGINEMTYNRCIGTKYCGNNCPYKVRRFNYFHYTDAIPETQKLVLNPDVTVRSRGVMEKCTMCVQRINQAKIAAKKETEPRKAREIIRGIQTACQQACPSEAIVFGDLNDPEKAALRVEWHHTRPRAYKMLEEINVRPRLSYMGRIKNPNVELEPPKPAASAHPSPAGSGSAGATPGSAGPGTEKGAH